jgi:hypothetical protein
LESLPEAVRKTVQYIGWQELCLSEEPDVVRAQFMRMYQQVAERRQKEAVLPPALKEAIAAIADKMDMRKQLEPPKKPLLRLVGGNARQKSQTGGNTQ